MDASTAGLTSASAPRMSVHVRAAISSFALPLSGFASGPIIARTLGVTGRGSYAIFVAVLSLVILVSTVGLDDALMVATARAGGVLKKESRWAVSFLGLVGLLTATVATLMLLITGAPLYNLAILAAPGVVLMVIIRTPVIAFGNIRVLGQERWLQAGLRLSGIIVLAAAGRLTVGTLVFAHVVAILLPASVLWRAYRRAPAAEKVNDLPLLRFGLTSYSAGLTGIVMLRLDQLLLAPISGREQLGLYAAAVALAEVVLFISSSVKVSLQGHIASSGSARAAYPFLKAIAAAVLLLPIVYVSAKPILGLLYGKEFEPAAGMLTVLLTACIPSALLDLSGAALMSLGNPRGRAISTTVAAIATLILLPPLALAAGGLGAAWASLISYSFGAAISLRYLLRGVRNDAKV